MPLYRVFHGDGASGNPCWVAPGEALGEAPGDASGAALGEAPPPPRWPAVTRCHTRAVVRGQASIACFTAASRPIACCGHGLLATARYWHEQGWRGSVQLDGLRCRRQRELTWVEFPRLATRLAAVPDWAERVLGSAPAGAALAGGDAGYLILEWPQDFPLRALSLPGSALAAHTARAVIACAASSGACRWQLRYFAPQYGVPEDDATGSAMRVLADYCQRRHGCERIDAFQCSPAGGVLHSRVAGDRVAVGGRVELMPGCQEGRARWTT